MQLCETRTQLCENCKRKSTKTSELLTKFANFCFFPLFSKNEGFLPTFSKNTNVLNEVPTEVVVISPSRNYILMLSDVNVCAETHSKNSEVSKNYKLSKERSNKSKRNNWLYNTSLFKQFQVNKLTNMIKLVSPVTNRI